MVSFLSVQNPLYSQPLLTILNIQESVLPQTNNVSYRPDSVAMVYSNNGIMQASLVINNNQYSDVKVGDNIADNEYKVVSIQPTQVKLLNLKTSKTRIIELL